MSPISKPVTESPMAKPEVVTPMAKPRELGGLDKFKNFWANISNKILAPMGVPEAHIIKPEDYVVNPATGKEEFSWNKANENFKKDNGRERQGFDIGKIAQTAAKYIK